MYLFFKLEIDNKIFHCKIGSYSNFDIIFKELEWLRCQVTYLEKELALRDDKIKSLENRFNPDYALELCHSLSRFSGKKLKCNKSVIYIRKA